MNRFLNEFWKPLTGTEKIEFSTVALLLLNLLVGLVYILINII